MVPEPESAPEAPGSLAHDVTAYGTVASSGLCVPRFPGTRLGRSLAEGGGALYRPGHFLLARARVPPTAGRMAAGNVLYGAGLTDFSRCDMST